MMGLEFTGEIPFSRVNVHTVIQAPDGRRMSKSLGTGIDPMQLIEGGPRPPVFAEGGDFPAYGADAVRWGLLAISSSQDVRFNEERVAQGRQLANKLYNASRLVLLRLPEDAALPPTAPAPATVEDAWILSRLQAAERDVARAIDDFDFHVAALRVYDFVYGELCDWYLELLKPRLYEEDNADAGEFALHVLGETLALAHPLIPFVTEEIWSHVPGADGLLMARRYPVADDALADPAAEAQLGRAIEAVQELRAWRDSVGAKPGRPIPARLEGDGYEATAEHVARLARLEWTSDGGDPWRRWRPGRDGGRVRLRRRRPRGRAARAPPRAARSSSPRSPAPRASCPTSASWPRRPRRSCRASGTSSRGCGRSSRSFDLVRAARRGAPALARAVRHALRPGAHAAPADGARQPAGALRGGPRRRHQRQELDGPHDRGAARGPRRAHGLLPLAAPRALRRADPDRRRGPLRRGLRRGGRSAPPPPPRRSTARSRAASA